MANKIQTRRGVKAKLPSSASAGEPLFSTDSHELFMGTGSGVVNMTGSHWYNGTAMSGTSTTSNAYYYNACPEVKVGDYYLHTSTGYVYECTTAGSGTTARWTYRGSLRGATGGTGGTGPQGTRGTRWNVGTACTGTSTSNTQFSTGISDSIIGDMYLNTSTGYVYKCTVAGGSTAARWVYVGSIKERGSKWFTGTAMSDTSTTTGAYTWNDSEQKYVNDMYLNTSNGNIYKCTTAGTGTNAKWTYQGCIAGKDAGTYVVTTVAELEAAATALNAASGGKIILREGTYTLSSILNLEKPIVLEGMGDSTIISFTGAGSLFFTMDDRAVFRNLKINYTCTGSPMCDGDNTDFDRCMINITVNGGACRPLIFSGIITNSDVTVDYRYASNECDVLLESGRINNSNVKIYNNTNATTGNHMGGELYIIGEGEISNCDLTVVGRESNSQYANVCGCGGTVSTITGNKITVGTYGSITTRSGGGSVVVGNNDITINGRGSVYIAGAISGNRFDKPNNSRIVYIGTNSTFNGNCVLNGAVNDFTPYSGTVSAFGNIFTFACSNLASTTYNKTTY